MRSTALPTAIAAMTILIAGCVAPPGSGPTPAEPTSSVDAGTTGSSPQPSTISGAGDFPMFPEGPLPEPVVASLQAVLDGAVEQGTIIGVTAAVIDADSGSWSGATGVDLQGKPLTPDAQLLICSVGKTVTAAQVLHLVEEGKLGLDDPVVDHLPRQVAFFDANGATIRDLLGMRSGIDDPLGYEALLDEGSTTELLKRTFSVVPAGSEINYASINYILLGMIIEHVTGQPLWEALRTGVLDRPGLDGLVYRVKNALAADGERIESNPATLARWGYELYGGFVLSDASLRHMTDFRGDWYGLGAVDYSQTTPGGGGGYGIPAIGHGGLGPTIATALVAFPQASVVVAVQALLGSLGQVAAVAGALRDAARP